MMMEMIKFEGWLCEVKAQEVKEMCCGIATGGSGVGDNLSRRWELSVFILLVRMSVGGPEWG